MNDPALISALQRLREEPADQDAWETLYHTLWPYLFAKLFRRFRGSRHLAEESAQEVMKLLASNLDVTARELTPASLMLYCNRTANSVFTDWTRKRENAEAISQSLDDPDFPMTALIAADPDPERSTMAREELELLMSKLDLRSRKIARHLLQGDSAKDVARSLGVTDKTAVNLISLLRLRIRKLFRPERE